MVSYLCVASTAGMVTLHIQSAYESRFFVTMKFTKLCQYSTVAAGTAVSS